MEWKTNKEKHDPAVINTETNIVICCHLGITAFPFMIHASQRKHRTIVPHILLPRWFQVRVGQEQALNVTLERERAEAIIQAGRWQMCGVTVDMGLTAASEWVPANYPLWFHWQLRWPVGAAWKLPVLVLQVYVAGRAS